MLFSWEKEWFLLTASCQNGIMKISKGGFLECPFCGNKFLKHVYPDERCERLCVFCRKCKREFYISIRDGQSFYNRAPSST